MTIIKTVHGDEFRRLCNELGIDDARISYLTAALDHTEQVALNTPYSEWRYVGYGGITADGKRDWHKVSAVNDGREAHVVSAVDHCNAAHIALHDPAAVLAGVQADRRLIKAYRDVERNSGYGGGWLDWEHR